MQKGNRANGTRVNRDPTVLSPGDKSCFELFVTLSEQSLWSNRSSSLCFLKISAVIFQEDFQSQPPIMAIFLSLLLSNMHLCSSFGIILSFEQEQFDGNLHLQATVSKSFLCA